jgi:hypothetical protein
VLITVELFKKNGLANHAAAGAYGFLFSAAPPLLFQEVLRFSHDADKRIITILSERLKKANEKLFV